MIQHVSADKANSCHLLQHTRYIQALREDSTSTAASRKRFAFSTEILPFGGFSLSFSLSSSGILQDVRLLNWTLPQLAVDCLLHSQALCYHSTFFTDGSKALLSL